jgi:dTDP-glucose pyrophosphorylase
MASSPATSKPGPSLSGGNQIKIQNHQRRLQSDEDKLGALEYQFRRYPGNLTKSNLLIVAGDNLFSESLAAFVPARRRPKQPLLFMMWAMLRPSKVGNIAIDADGIITHFEKSQRNPSTLAPSLSISHPKCFRF